MKYAPLLFFLLLTQNSFAQDFEEKPVAVLDSFATFNPQEKVYLQTNRNSFVSGETIWFKSYTTLNGVPSILSKLVYVTMSDENGNLIEKKQYKLNKGSADGDIHLKKELPAGNYYLTAYTLWMLNFPNFNYSKKITIYNTGKPNKLPAKPRSIVFNFFPEGGNIIEGITCNMAIKATDRAGNPLQVKGKIYNAKNVAVASLNTSNEGTGKIEFLSEATEQYYASLEGYVERFPLPRALKEGITIKCDNAAPGKAFVKLERGASNKEKYNNLLLVAQQNYKVIYMAKINFDEGMDAVAINKKNLASGIVQVTVFTKAGIPLAERLFFISNYDTPNLSGSFNNAKRQRNIFEIDLSNYKNPDAAVSVIDLATDPKHNEENILSGLLFSSDLRGRIVNPAKYFRDKADSTLQQIDLLMMVNGWSRFSWTDILSNKFPAIKYPFETSLSITGKVLQTDQKSALKSGKINLIIKGEDSTTIMSEALVNSNSEFVVPDINFKQSATVHYQGTNTNNKNALVSIKMNPAYFDSLKTNPVSVPPSYSLDPNTTPLRLQTMLAEKAKNDTNRFALLQEVTVKARKGSAGDSLTRLYASPIFEMSDQSLAMDGGNYFDIWQYLQRMVPGINIAKTDTGNFVSFDRYNGLNFFSQERGAGVQFFLNEVPVSADVVDFINPRDLSLVKVYKGVTGIALGADRGAIALYTTKGTSVRDWRVKGFDYMKKAGYSIQQEFYNADYSKVGLPEGMIDNRTDLLWQPYLPVKNGKAQVEFYNNDISTQLKIVVEGIDADGKLFSIEKILQ